MRNAQRVDGTGRQVRGIVESPGAGIPVKGLAWVTFERKDLFVIVASLLEFNHLRFTHLRLAPNMDWGSPHDGQAPGVSVSHVHEDQPVHLYHHQVHTQHTIGP